jgi:ABC-type multidrug transport system fused ATPase/permease subunit
MHLLLHRLWIKIRRRRKKQFALTIALVLISSVMEVVSIGAVLPFLGVLSNPEAMLGHEMVGWALKLGDVSQPDHVLLVFTVLFISVSLLAGLMRILLLRAQVKLAHATGFDLSYDVFRKTLFRPYEIHIQNNSSELLAAVTTKVNQVVSNVILPILQGISAILILVLITAVLISIQPLVTCFTIITFLAIYGVVVAFVRGRLYSNSAIISRNSELIIKILQEGLGNIRDVILGSKQDPYCQAFRKADLVRRKAVADNQIIGQAPKYCIEAAGIGLMALLAFTLTTNGSFENAVPLLGVLAVAAQRMLPQVHLAYSAITSLRGAQVILNDTLLLLEQVEPDHAFEGSAKAIEFRNVIRLENISFRYRQDSSWIIRKLTLEIRKGTRIGFIGETGSGKSTLLDIISGLLVPTDGAVQIDGKDIKSDTRADWYGRIAHIPQVIYLSDATIAENIAFGVPPSQIDFKRVSLAARISQIEETIESWAHKYQTIVGEYGVRLSGGQRQRLAIARALYSRSEVLILDEATSALDQKTERLLMDAIYGLDEGITILMVAHRLSTLRLCDQIVELRDGSIARVAEPAQILGAERCQL